MNLEHYLTVQQFIPEELSGRMDLIKIEIERRSQSKAVRASNLTQCAPLDHALMRLGLRIVCYAA